MKVAILFSGILFSSSLALATNQVVLKSGAHTTFKTDGEDVRVQCEDSDKPICKLKYLAPRYTIYADNEQIMEPLYLDGALEYMQKFKDQGLCR